MLEPYVPLLLLLVLVSGMGVMMIAMSRMWSHRRPTRVKGEPYESGIQPITDARGRFSVKFYLVAVLFLLFDIETVFLVPWAVAFRREGAGALFLLVEVLVFLVVLAVAYLYVWKRGALDWE